MMLDSLEARRLFAAAPTATLKNGILTLTGMPGDDQIKIEYGIRTPVGTPGDVSSIKVVGAYVVTFNHQGPSQTFDTADVKQVNVYGLAGRDVVTGPKSFDNLIVSGTVDTTSVDHFVIHAEKLAPLFVDGGSGSDRLTGGTGDDTLVGGRGNDYLTDQYGRNALFGGAGRDTYNTTEGSVRVVRGTEAGQTPYVRQVAGGTNAAPDQLFDVNQRGVSDIVTSDNGVDTLSGFGGVLKVKSIDSSAVGSDTDTLVVPATIADEVVKID